MHILLEAGPGSGKTTTLVTGFHYQLTEQYNIKPTQEQVNACYYIRENFKHITTAQTVFIAFNDTTKQKLIKSLPSNCKVHTFNGLGQSILFKKKGHGTLDLNRGQKILEKLLGKQLTSLPYPQRVAYYSMLKYISCCKEELLDPNVDNFYRIQEKYGLNEVPQDIELCQTLFRVMAQYEGDFRSYEWIDQVWLGMQQLQKPMFELAYVDESQDISALRLELVLRAATNVLFCGDPFQSINAFAGADHQAFEKLRAISKIQLPLKTCFRMPPNHIEHANSIRPARIIPWKTEPGPIEVLQQDRLADTIKLLQTSPEKYQLQVPVSTPSFPLTKEMEWNIPDSSTDLDNYLLIARTNATLFKFGIYLLKNRIPARIIRRKEDADIEKILIQYLKQLTHSGTTRKVHDIPTLQQLLQKDISKAQSMSFKQGSALLEKAECLMFLSKEVNVPEEIPNIIQTLIADRTNSVRLSTIHKAKGLEAPFIFILYPPVPNPKAQTTQEKEQEKNIEFVSETRSEYYKAYVKE